MKKKVTTIICAVLGLILAATAAFVVIKYDDLFAKKSNQKTNTSQTQNIIEQPTDIPTVEITPSEYMSFTSPTHESFTTTDSTLTFKGAVLDGKEIKLDGAVLSCDENGNFEKKVDLKYGSNSFTFTVGEETKTFTIYRRYIIITSYTPNNAQTYSAGAKLTVSAEAL